MAGFSFRQGFRSRDPVAPESATWIGARVASVGIQGVAFIRATFRPRAERDQRRLSALLFLTIACWSAILTLVDTVAFPTCVMVSTYHPSIPTEQ